MAKIDSTLGAHEATYSDESVFEAGMLNIAYILYLVGFVFPIAPLVGLVFAYLQEPSGHRQFIIRTFWIGVLMCFVGAVLAIVLIGWLVILFWAIWTMTRVISGFMLVNKGQDLKNPKSWGFLAK